MRLILILTIICVIAALMLGVTYSVTIDKIEMQKENSAKEALRCVLPLAADFSQKINGSVLEYYKGLDRDGKVIGFAFIGEGKGYSSVISIMIGVDTQCAIQGIKILSQNETPGLGTRVQEIKGNGTIWDLLKGKKQEKAAAPWFQKQFGEKPLDKIDMITGATITSKAVINTVKNTVEKFKEEPRTF